MGLGHEHVPFGEREFGVADCEPRTEVIFPVSDGALGGVAPMDVWWCLLEVYRVFRESLLHEVGTFVVKDVESWGKSVVSELEV
jgi:hypothetical protein